jgi:hypothetical protein
MRLQRLKAVATKLDSDLVRLASTHSIDELEKYPEWNKLIAVRKAMFKVLPLQGDGTVPGLEGEGDDMGHVV